MTKSEKPYYGVKRVEIDFFTFFQLSSSASKINKDVANEVFFALL